MNTTKKSYLIEEWDFESLLIEANELSDLYQKQNKIINKSKSDIKDLKSDIKNLKGDLQFYKNVIKNFQKEILKLKTNVNIVEIKE